jgi:hypothetical protein
MQEELFNELPFISALKAYKIMKNVVGYPNSMKWCVWLMKAIY